MIDYDIICGVLKYNGCDEGQVKDYNHFMQVSLCSSLRQFYLYGQDICVKEKKKANKLLNIIFLARELKVIIRVENSSNINFLLFSSGMKSIHLSIIKPLFVKGRGKVFIHFFFLVTIITVHA